MKTIKAVVFKEQNALLGLGQEGYDPLPVHLDESKEQVLTICWRPTSEQLKQINETGEIWQQFLTLGNGFLPTLVWSEKPFIFVTPKTDNPK